MKNLDTPWTQSVGEKPHQEYPRPQFVRDSYVNLNGKWQYAITNSRETPKKYDGKILVPFSPESNLSGVGRQLQPDEFLHYRTRFDLSAHFNKGVVLLHFGAVDSICSVRLNGKEVGGHVGGYNSFTVEVTDAIDEHNVLDVVVRDFSDSSYHTFGKQRLHRGGIWYTAQSGIWQTVWLESVAPQYIRSAKITPLFDSGEVKIELDKCNVDFVTAAIYDDGKEIAKTDGAGNVLTVRFPDGEFTPWTPENPKLYDLLLISRRDKVRCYFGMRKISVEEGDPARLMLNNKPYYHHGVLDQGYWSDGLYTAPTDEAMVFDILTAKSLGFNMLRKHVKVEPLRWYYHCDRLGMLVWQDMPNGGSRYKKSVTMVFPFLGGVMDDKNYRLFGRKNKEGREEYLAELAEMTDNLYNCTCIAVWCPFNEGWGQFDAAHAAERLKMRDPTRLVDHASGWHDQKGGDFVSLHVYFKDPYIKTEKQRAAALTEFGGFGYCEAEHRFNDKTFGYKNFDNQEKYRAGVTDLFEKIIPLVKKGLTASVYTQLTDVEDEINGLITYDRKQVKVDKDEMIRIGKLLKNNDD